MTLLERYIVHRGDKRRTRWWKQAAAADPPPFGWLRTLLEPGDRFVLASKEELLAVDDWATRTGLGTPPIGMLDRYDARPEARAFADRVSMAMVRGIVVGAIREVCLERDVDLRIWPDALKEDVWHLSLGESDWSWTADGPCAVLEKMLRETMDDVRQRADDASTVEA